MSVLTSSGEDAARVSPSPAPPDAGAGAPDVTPPPGLTAEEQHRVTALYERLNRIDHYRLLDVSATEDVKGIRRAYFAKAKEWHPDRWFRRPIGSAMKSKIDAIFAALAGAEKTLTDKTKRAEYDLFLREQLKTRLARRQADALEADRCWAQAAEVWARIVENLPTDAYVQHRFAYALLRAGQRLDVAMAAATRAIELDSTRAEYRTTAASLHLAEGRDRQALAQLAVAVEIDPDRLDIAALHAAMSERVARLR